MTRYKDASTALYEWFKKVQEKGAVDGDTKKEPDDHRATRDEPAAASSWKLTNAVITGYSMNAANAQTHDLMTETVTLTYEDAEQEPSAMLSRR